MGRSKAQLGVGKSYSARPASNMDVLNETATEIVFLEVELKPLSRRRTKGFHRPLQDRSDWNRNGALCLV